MNKTFLYLFALIVILFTSFLIVRKVKKNRIPQINLSALAIKSLDGVAIDLESLKGKPLVINFWGTWCGPCRQEMAGFEKAKLKYDEKVNFVMVSDEPVDKLLKFKAANNYTLLYAQSQMPFQELGITSVPFTYIYDATGMLVYKKKDVLSEEELEKVIESIR